MNPMNYRILQNAMRESPQFAPNSPEKGRIFWGKSPRTASRGSNLFRRQKIGYKVKA
jgi:hypothetical protein